jgi:hypothetical protein
MVNKLLPDRFRPRQLTAKRLGKALLRRIQDVPDSLAWRLELAGARSNKQRIRKLKDSRAGERCVIMGNGPSLKTMDLELISDEITFGLNRIYLLYPEINFCPTYLAAVNELVLEQFAEDFRSLEVPLFMNWNQRNLFDLRRENYYFLKTHLGLKDYFSADLAAPISTGGTVTFVAMQIAFYLGFEEVILIGVDHNFQQKGVPNLTERRSEQVDVDHFHPDYFPKGSRWQLPDLRRSELAYQLARQAFEESGRVILDATVNGQCQVFEKVNYQTYFK